MAHLRQYAALPYVVVADRVLVLLVTSRDTGRWVIPKGWPKKSRTPAELAALEALEEAGVEGEIAAKPLGVFTYRKRLDDLLSVRCRVEVFALRVAAEHVAWPEQRQRRRCWMLAEDAAAEVAEAELRDLIRKLARSHARDARDS